MFDLDCTLKQHIPDALEIELSELTRIESETPSPEATKARQDLEIKIYGTTHEEADAAMREAQGVK